ncbi:MAG: hypothetical protein K2Q22_13560, partial [Cytophagales bacterium]|nr:hypothetical protein [Cytophagales bacterium]
MTKTEYSMGGIEIREMHSSQKKEYKEFFMEGLVADEKNFRISPSDELSAPFPTLNQMDSFTLAAYVNHELAGVVSFSRDGAD